MALTPTTHVQSVAWNSISFDDTDNGVLSVEFAHEGTPIEDRVADQSYPSSVFITDKSASVRLVARHAKFTEDLDCSTSNLVITLAACGGVTLSVTLATMMLVSVRTVQPRAGLSETELIFLHQSAAQANPIS